MTGECIIIRSRKFDQRIRRTWLCELVEHNAEMLLAVGEFDRDVAHAGLGAINRGTVSYEYYWFDRWYNIFRFHKPDGTFRNYYCNICMPARFENRVVDYVDLDIDIVVWSDLRVEILDWDDFERNSLKYEYPLYVREQSLKSLDTLIDMIEKRDFPFTTHIKD